ncbi:MAG: hypothetical protein J7J65_06320 [Candidatus Korarchaeota archaeon]|nr:hypothetical protein [Candidatus Korarchaeota archaeon]
MALAIEVKDDAAGLGIFVAYNMVEGVKVGPLEDDLYLREAAERIRSKYTLQKLREDPIVRAYRDFYWRIGIDPTKTRPSSEAMVRRVLRGGSFPRINNVVDAGNVASALTLVPIGLYDLDKVRGPMTLRLARPGEIFHPIGGGEEVLEGGEPVLADEEEVLFLYPHRDSRKTMITSSTTKVVVLGAGVPGVEVPRVRKAVNLAVELIERFAGGHGGETKVSP